jgi:hypothetical protein
MNKDKIQISIKNELKEDNLNEALRLLIRYFEDDEAIVLSGRLKTLKAEVTRGIISYENQNLELNRIRQSILNITNDLTSKNSKYLIRKLEFLAKILLNKKKNRIAIFIAFLYFFGEKKIKIIAIFFCATILTIIGVNYYISSNDMKYIIFAGGNGNPGSLSNPIVFRRDAMSYQYFSTFNFASIDLSNTNLEYSDLSFATLENAIINCETNFKAINAHGLSIENVLMKDTSCLHVFDNLQLLNSDYFFIRENGFFKLKFK